MIIETEALRREFRIGRVGHRRTVVTVDGVDLRIEPAQRLVLQP